MSSGERVIDFDPSVIVAADVETSKLAQLVKQTALVKGIGGYKLGMTLGLDGLTSSASILRDNTDKPLIFDYQKAGNDIPAMGAPFARICKRAGIDAVILFPFAGPETERAWIDASKQAGLGVLVGAHMTQPKFLVSEGGYISDDAPERIFTLAASLGVHDFVVPGNKVEFVRKYKNLFDDLLGDGNYTLYAPGFVTQEGVISDFAQAAGAHWHAIVGSAIYSALNMKEAAEMMTQQLA